MSIGYMQQMSGWTRLSSQYQYIHIDSVCLYVCVYVCFPAKSESDSKLEQDAPHSTGNPTKPKSKPRQPVKEVKQQGRETVKTGF